ncbi:hypothetical protein DPMN_098395 [Dreissena polymorpha]|uniref:Uncharacterized protein n=1 Tax=Dreissena polymorpha TaxID=45954 RepID=A0A9D4R785_DREPO|nr:hypothetical protein DPMN_098395 [Dreissena polymorpha]
MDNYEQHKCVLELRNWISTSGIADRKLHLVEDACIGRGELEDLFNRFPSHSAYRQGDLSNERWVTRTCLQWSEVRCICSMSKWPLGILRSAAFWKQSNSLTRPVTPK